MTLEIAGLGAAPPTQGRVGVTAASIDAAPDASMRSYFASSSAHAFFVANAGQAALKKALARYDETRSWAPDYKFDEQARRLSVRNKIRNYRARIVVAGSALSLATAQAWWKSTDDGAADAQKWINSVMNQGDRTSVRGLQGLGDVGEYPLGLSKTQVMLGVAGLAAFGIWYTLRRGEVI